jgi:chromosome segregation ATPase
MSAETTEGLSAQAPSVEGRAAGNHSTRARKKTRPRNRDKTLGELKLAMLTVKNRGQELTISAVALEVGVEPSLIHNTYPTIAEAIRDQAGKSTRKRLDDKIAELSEVRERNKELRADLATALSDIRRLSSSNETLRQEVDKLRSAASGNVVILPSRDLGNC